MSGSAVKSHGWPKTRRVLSARQIISYFLSFQGYPPILKAVRVLHRQFEDSLRSGAEQAPRELVQPASSSSSSSVLERSDEPASRRLVQFPEIQNLQLKRWSDKKNSKDPLADLPDWLQDFRRNSERKRIACIRTQFSGIGSGTILRKWQRNQGSTILTLTSQKRPRLLRILENQNSKGTLQKTLWRSSSSCRKVWWLDNGSITKSSMRDVNQETITGTLSWYKILLLNGLNHIRVKRNLHMRRREVYQNSWSRRTDRKLFTQTTRWNLGKHVKVSSWNHRTSTPHRSDTNGIAERAVRRVKEGTSAVLLQSGLDERWWSDSMECYCCLRNIQDLLGEGKTPYEWRFGEPLKGPMIPFGALIEYHPISSKRQSRIHQFGKKVLPGIFLKLWASRGRNLERRYSDSDSGRFGIVGCIRHLSSKSTRKKYWSDKKMMNSFSHLQNGTAKCVRKRKRIPRIHSSKAGTNRKERRFQQRTSWWTGRVSTD